MVLESIFPPDTRVENEIMTLNNAGYEVDIACLSNSCRKKVDTFGSSKIFCFPISSFVKKSSIGALNFSIYFNFWRKRLSKLIVDNDYKVVHIHDLPLAKVGGELQKKYNIKFVLDLHENWPALLNLSEHTKTLLGKLFFSMKQWKSYEETYVKIADKLIVVIEESKKRIEDMGVKSDRIKVISNTLNIKEFNFLTDQPKSDKTIYVYAGGVTYHRGLQYIIEAASKTKSENYNIWIIGDGRYLKKLKEKTKLLALNERVTFFGWQKRDELLKLVSKANVALIPHIKSDHTDNTIPHKLFQYMYAEKPILSSNCAPLERIIMETSSGITYRYDDIDQIARIMDGINNKEIRLCENSIGKESVINKYNWDVDSKNLLSLYSEL